MNKKQNPIKQMFIGIFKDLLIVILDILAVNAAYYLALLIRYYISFSIYPSASQHVADFFKFAPWYTIACIIIFAINDDNLVIHLQLVVFG